VFLEQISDLTVIYTKRENVTMYMESVLVRPQPIILVVSTVKWSS